MLKEIGFDGAGYALWLGDDVEKNLKIADEAGVKLHLFWAYVNLNPEKGKPYDPRLPEAIRKLKGRPATVAVLLRGFKPGDPQGMGPGVKVLRELGDAAAEAGVRISIYNHVGDWSERVPFIVDVVKQVNHPQVGFNFNLCHWLKVEGRGEYGPLLRENAAKLFCVTISGATVGAAAWTNGLIQPLDQGDFDHRPLLALLDEIGYRGPVGLMCFGVPGDAREHLARSMAAWRKLKQSLSPGK